MSSLLLYVLTGLFCLPVVAVQMQLRNLARAAEARGADLRPRNFQPFCIWIACGIPAFLAVLVIIWLMLARPELPPLFGSH